MPITDSQLLFRFLDILAASPHRWAILHQSDRLTSLKSDLDLVCDRPAHIVLQSLRQELQAADLHPIVLWPYEAGGSADVFFVDRQANEGIQIDVLFDPDGRGKLGIKSGELLERAERGREGFPHLDPTAQWLYLLRKRVVKGQWERVDELLTSLPAPRSEIDRLVGKYGNRSFVRGMNSVLSGRRPRITPGIRRWTPRTVRQRLGSPVGAWVHVAGEEAGSGQSATAHSDAFSRVLPYAGKGRVPNSSIESIIWWFSRVMSIRLRAGIYMSWGRAPSLVSPDVTIDLEDNRELIVAALSQRINLQISNH